jgi:transposase-like protein
VRCVDAAAARRFFTRALRRLTVISSEVLTDAASVYPAVPAELVPSAWHHVEQHANNRIEADHGQLKHRLRPMRGLQNHQTAQVVIAGHAFVQNLRRPPLRIRSRRPWLAAGRRCVHRTRPGDLTTRTAPGAASP